MLTPSVTTLLTEVRDGSPVALERLIEACGPRLLILIRLRMTPDLRRRMESGDLLNATLLRAVRGIDRLDATNTPSLMAWLARVAENEIHDQRDHIHAQRRDLNLEVPADSHSMFDRLASTVRSQTSRLLLSERLERLERALGQLPDEQREIILLRQLEELSFKTIGERLGKSPDACRMQLARAMTALTLRMTESA